MQKYLQISIFFCNFACLICKRMMIDTKNAYFLGIGGIGMSAIARYLHHAGWQVAGYDRTETALTAELAAEGISVCYDDDATLLPDWVDRNTLIVFTPAIPADSRLRQWAEQSGCRMVKRSEILGEITDTRKALCVAGSHGKTTTTTMIAHIMHQSHIGAGAFLGGISENYHSNLILDNSPYVAVEADEFDRSFLRLHPWMSVISSVDADHLDIYGDEQGYKEGFAQYTALITGALVVKYGLKFTPRLQPGTECYTYAREDARAHYYATNIHVHHAKAGDTPTIHFDLHTPERVIPDIALGVPIWINVENAVAAAAMCLLNGVTDDELREGLRTFRGVERRFNILADNGRVAYIDDYAHHPTEIAATIASARLLYPRRKLICIFQPHLFTRTRDQMDDFASVLSMADEVLLMPIYPAREKPIKGITSQALGEKIQNNHVYCPKRSKVPQVVEQIVRHEAVAVVMTLGAGDISLLREPITKIVQEHVFSTIEA